MDYCISQKLTSKTVLYCSSFSIIGLESTPNMCPAWSCKYKTSLNQRNEWLDDREKEENFSIPRQENAQLEHPNHLRKGLGIGAQCNRCPPVKARVMSHSLTLKKRLYSAKLSQKET